MNNYHPRRRSGALAAWILLPGLVLAGCESTEKRELRGLIEETAQLQTETLEVLQRRIEFAETGEAEITSPIFGRRAERLEREREQRAEGYAEQLETLWRAFEQDDWEVEYPETFMLGNDVQPRQIVAQARNAARDGLETERERLEQDLAAEERRQAQEAEQAERRQQAEERRQEREAELEQRLQQAEERRQVLAAERAAAAAERQVQAEERRRAREAAAAERERQAEERRRAREAELREQIPVRIEALEELYDAVAATYEEAARVHPDRAQQRQASNGEAMARLTKRQTMQSIQASRDQPFATLESTWRLVNTRYREAEQQMANAREQLAQAQAAASR